MSRKIRVIVAEGEEYVSVRDLALMIRNNQAKSGSRVLDGDKLVDWLLED